MKILRLDAKKDQYDRPMMFQTIALLIVCKRQLLNGNKFPLCSSSVYCFSLRPFFHSHRSVIADIHCVYRFSILLLHTYFYSRLDVFRNKNLLPNLIMYTGKIVMLVLAAAASVLAAPYPSPISLNHLEILRIRASTTVNPAAVTGTTCTDTST
jgi:hypothetical protein